MENVRLEVAVDTAESVVGSIRGGAQRLELCSCLVDGGLTPSFGFLEWAREQSDLPLHCMVRPRGGNFTYSAEELTIMNREIQAMRKAGADGVVLGVLTSDSHVDISATRRLISLARPMRVAFHRAFDLTEEPEQALEEVIACGADILLTSGGAPSLELGLPVVAKLVAQAAGRIEIMGGAGVRVENAASLWAGSDVDTLHASLRRPRPALRHTQGEGRASIGARDADQQYTVHEQDVRDVLAALAPRTARPPVARRSNQP